jgi:hypothetical protein
MPRSTSSSIRIYFYVYKQNSLSEQPVICTMKGWVLLNSTVLEHRDCLYGNNFPGMVPWCFPTNHTLITSCSLPPLLKKELRGCNLKHAVDNKVHLNIVLQENACHGILNCFKQQYKCSQKCVAA